MIGKRITGLRKESGLSQTELANNLGISRSALSLYEIEKREPDGETLARFANYFHVSTDYLLGISDKPEPANATNSSVKILTERLSALLNEDDVLTINEYARMAHIDVTDLQNYIDGKSTPSTYEVCKLAEVFDTSADYLFGKSDEPHPGSKPVRLSEDSFARILSREMDGNYLEAELANELDISISRIKKMLCGEEPPSPDILEDLAQILKKSTDYMLGFTDIPREADASGHYPFHMDEKSVERFQEILGTEWEKNAEYDTLDLGLTYDEYYMMYHYGFIPHISILQKLCRKFNVSADYLLNNSDSKLCINISKEIDEDDLLKEYRKLEKPYRKKISGLLADQLLQQERDNYMRSSSVAADEKYIDSQGKSQPSSSTEGGTLAV